jgi:hypothetical protein
MIINNSIKKNVKERDQAMERLQGQIMFKSPLRVTLSEAKEDPMKEVT